MYRSYGGYRVQGMGFIGCRGLRASLLTIEEVRGLQSKVLNVHPGYLKSILKNLSHAVLGFRNRLGLPPRVW